MKRCPITYEAINEDQRYSLRGLHLLSKQLKNLEPLNLNADEQRQEAISRAGKMSIQGIQPKLSAQLNIKESRFQLVDQYGNYILKPQNHYYPELPENEAVTMSMAAISGLEVPVHGLLYSKDNSMTYFVKRFDRAGHRQKFSLEDFAQLSDVDTDSKYKSSMEKVSKIVEQFCTFPRIEFLKLFKITLFNFLVGNEDLHLKNFSLITKSNKVTLSPAYDFLNSTIAQKNSTEEIALPLNGKKNNLQLKDFVSYFGSDVLKLNSTVIGKTLTKFQQIIPLWENLINNSFLSPDMKDLYLSLLRTRSSRLKFK